VKREDCDLHTVRPEHIAIHERAMNWARYVKDGRGNWGIQPMFKHYRPERDNGHAVEIRYFVDTLDGHKLEKAVGQLPEKHRDAIRWHYCFSFINPGRVQRELGVTRMGLADLIHDARSMLKNRSVTK
jgi:hypothetical protein